MCTQSVLLASHDYSVSEYAHVPNNFYKSGVPVLLHHYFWGRGLKTLGTPDVFYTMYVLYVVLRHVPC